MPPVIIALLTSLSAGALTLFASRFRSRKISKEAPSLEDVVKVLAANLESASASISQIESEILKRKEVVAKLKQDAELFQQLKDLNQAQVEAIAQTIRGEVATISNKSIWINAIVAFVIAAIFFVIGFFVARI